jgi:hypothetical protein
LPRILGNFFSLSLRLAEVRGISCGVLRVMVAEHSDESGRLMMQSVLATRASAALDFIHGLRGTLVVTF